MKIYSLNLLPTKNFVFAPSTWFKRSNILVFLLAFGFYATNVFGQTTLGTSPYTVPSSGNYIIPAGVTSITVTCYGGGGAGGGASTGNFSCGGGGGGACVTVTNYTVTALSQIVVVKGAGGIGTTAGSVNGSASSVTVLGAGSPFISADYGRGGTTAGNGVGGVGGAIANNIPANTGQPGGKGGNGMIATTLLNNCSGGGGGGAGTTNPGGAGGNGNNAVPSAGTAGTGGATGGSNGGLGQNTSANCGAAGGAASSSATTFGGGGGGATHYQNACNALGGNGAAGAVIITYCATPLSAPTVGSTTQPTCAIQTGSVALSGLPASGSWTITASPGGATQTSTGTTTSFTGLTPGSAYTFIVTQGACISPASVASATIAAAPVIPAAPTVTTPVSYCQGATASALTATGASLLWYTVATLGTGSSTAPTPSTSTAGTPAVSYWVSQTTTCESARSQINVNISPAPTSVTATNNGPKCVGGALSLTAGAASNMFSYKWDGPNSTGTSGQIYQQDFSLLPTSGSPIWVDDVYIPGWYQSAPTSLIVDAGTATTAGSYNYGGGVTNPNTDRALGAKASTTAKRYALKITNNTGATVDRVFVSYAGERWRIGTSNQTNVFAYQVNAAGIASGTYTAVTALDFKTSDLATPTGTAAATDGNAAAHRAIKTATINVTITAGSSIWLRWSHTAASTTVATQQSLGIDDVKVILYNSGNTLLATPSTSVVSGTTFSSGFISSDTYTIPSATASNSGLYTLTAYPNGDNSCAKTATTTATVNANPTSSPSYTANPICTGSSTTLGAGAAAGSGSLSSYLWSTGGTGSSITASAAGPYTVTVTNSNNCTVVGTSGTLSFNSNPSPTASNDGPYCAGESIALHALPGSLTTYSWSGPSSYSASGQNPTRASSTTAMGGAYDVTVTDNNGCTATASTTVVVNDCSFTWTGATSSVWTEPTNWSPNSQAGGPNGCNIDVTIPGSLSVYPQLNSGKAVGNLTMGNGSNLGIGAAGGLTVCLDITGGSSTSAVLRGQGRVELVGTVDQDISGKVNFNKLIINKNSGLTTVTGTVSIDTGGMILTKGNITASGTVTLKSRASHTAYLDDFTSGTAGSYTGNLTVERYNSGTGSGGYNGADFHYLSSPVVSDFADWSEIYSNFATTGSGPIKPLANCNPDSIDYTSSYGTVMEWIENAAFPTNCSQEGWSVIPQSATTIDVGKGYTTYLQPAQTVTVVGAPNTGNQAVTLTKSTKTTVREPGTGTYITPGGNLVGNPYPSPYEWDRFGGNTNIGLTAYAWVTSGGYKGTYQNINVGSNIAIGQGFMVLANSAGTYNFQQNKRKAVANPTFYKNQNGASLVVEVAGNNFQDKTEVAFNDQSTPAFDLDFDGYKMMSKSAQPTLFTGLSSVKKLSLNTQPSIAQAPTVPMGMYVGTNGNFTFTFDNIASFDPTTYIFLEDKQTATMQDMRANNSYSFVGNTADATDRFVIHFTPPMDVTTTDASCTTTGTIKLEQPGTASWTYTLKDNGNNTISTGTINSNTPASIAAANGIYTLELVDAAGYNVSQSIQVNGVASIAAAFNSSASSVRTNEAINFNNTTSGASTYSWDFGDGSNAITTATATHSYAAAGTYTVTLTVTNAAGCQSSVTRSVTVSNATGITEATASSMNIFSFDDKVVVDFSKMKNVEATIQIYNLIGQELSSEKHVGSSVYTKELNEIDAAYVLVRVRSSNGQLVTKKVFISNSK